jgi:serine/threonine protein kinase
LNGKDCIVKIFEKSHDEAQASLYTEVMAYERVNCNSFASQLIASFPNVEISGKAVDLLILEDAGVSLEKCPYSLVQSLETKVLLALGEIHKEGVLHNDIRLQNFVVDSEGFVRVIDFGEALFSFRDNNEYFRKQCQTEIVEVRDLFRAIRSSVSGTTLLDPLKSVPGLTL